MIIVIKGKRYPLKSVEEVELLDLLDLAAEGKEFGRDLSLAGIETIEAEIGKIKHKDEKTQGVMRARHPDALLLQGISLWATRRCAGEQLTLREALRVSYSEISYLQEADDPAEGKDPRSARPASGRAAKRAPAARSTRKTSAKR